MKKMLRWLAARWLWVLGSVGVGALALGIVAVLGFYAVVLRPLWSLPRPIEEIEADWAAFADLRPTEIAVTPLDPAVVAMLEAGDLDALGRWLDDGGTIEFTGCALLSELTDDSSVPTFAMFEAAQGFLHRGDTEHAFALTRMLAHGELIQVAVAEALMAELPEHRAADPIDSQRILEAVAHEAACADATVTALEAGRIANDHTSLLDLDVSRARVRSETALLVLLVREHLDDPVALANALVTREPKTFDTSSAPLVGVLTFGLQTVVLDLVRSQIGESALPSSPSFTTPSGTRAWRGRIEGGVVEFLDPAEAPEGVTFLLHQLVERPVLVDGEYKTWGIEFESSGIELSAVEPLRQLAREHALVEQDAVVFVDSIPSNPSEGEAGLVAQGWELAQLDQIPEQPRLYKTLSPGETVGVLRFVDPTNPRPLGPGELPVTRHALAELPPVGGWITLTETTELSAPMLRARALGIPVLQIEHTGVLGAGEGDWVRLVVTDQSATVLRATPEEFDAWWETHPLPLVERPPNQLAEASAACPELRSPRPGAQVLANGAARVTEDDRQVLLQTRPGRLPVARPIGAIPETVGYRLGAPSTRKLTTDWSDVELFVDGPYEPLLTSLDGMLSCGHDALAGETLYASYAIGQEAVWVTAMSTEPPIE